MYDRIGLRQHGIDVVIMPIFVKEPTQDRPEKKYSFFAYTQSGDNFDEIGAKEASKFGGYVRNPPFDTYEEAEDAAVKVSNEYLQSKK